jgi:cytoskeleton protein RodZ
VLTWAHISGRKDNAVTRLHDPDVADPPIGEFSASELGAMLRETRMTQGRQLDEIAEELRIRLVYLQAIEDGRLEELPGVTYATGFLRAYGDFLGLDGEDLVRRFKAAGMATAQATDLHLPSPVEEGRLPTGSVLLVAALLAVGAYGGWYYMSSQGRDPIENVAALPDQLADLVGKTGQNGEPAAAPDTGSSPAVAEFGQANPTGMESSVGDASNDPHGDATASNSPEPTEPMATAEDASPDTRTTSTVVSAASADDSVSAPAEPMGSAPETAGEPATASVADQPTSDPDPSTAQTARADPEPEPEPVRVAAPEPPAVPRPKPVIVEQLAAPRVPEVTPTDPDGGAPAASTIVAEATSRANPGGGNGAQTAAAVAERKAHRVVLRANIDTWVEVAAAEGAPVLSRLMREGETFVVPSRPGLMMTTGNAGGIDILIDGKAIPQLGSHGEVRTNIVLDAESLLGGRVATP